MDQRVMQQKFYGPLKGNKINTTPNADPFYGVRGASFQLMFMLPYFSMVKIPLGLVTLTWTTASSRLNT